MNVWRMRAFCEAYADACRILSRAVTESFAKVVEHDWSRLGSPESRMPNLESYLSG